MIKNEIFKKFLQNPDLKDICGIEKNQIDQMDLFSETNHKVIEVIKTAILHTENGDSVDLSARRINQLFKKS